MNSGNNPVSLRYSFKGKNEVTAEHEFRFLNEFLFSNNAFLRRHIKTLLGKKTVLRV
jgi:hypothetical protein